MTLTRIAVLPAHLVTCYWCSCCSSDDFTGHDNRPNVVVEKMTSGILVASMAGTCETTGPEFGCTQQVQKVVTKDNLEKIMKHATSLSQL